MLGREAGDQPASAELSILGWFAGSCAPHSPSTAPKGERIPDKTASNGNGTSNILFFSFEVLS